MIEVKITPEQLERAKKLYDFTALKGSINKGADNLTGALGEVIVADYFKAKGYTVEEKATYNYDIILNGFKVDIKSTKSKAPPKSYHYARIQKSQIKQKTEFYFFCRVLEDYSKVYILGYLKKEEFFKIAKFAAAGSKDPSPYCTNKDFRYKADNYYTEIFNLKKFKQ